ncbi:DNA-directed RNA polymerase subunit K [Candidatus Woesearchaeota archaeon]|nr:DNA-directed RNA polymerase subunit K [Candidatus Woesearchaeota archaeon]
MQYNKYEKARIIGARALQIAMGAPMLVKLSEKDLEEIKFNPIEISKKEFNKGILPITIKRPMPRKV